MSTDPQTAARNAWRLFLETYEPVRADLFRYCRHLTGNVWDAEDLAQETLARAYVQLGRLFEQRVESPRAWLFTVASNAWIDRMRRAKETLEEGGEPADTGLADARGVRESGGTLLAQLSPQERAAVVLKEAFDMSLEEIAAALSTTVGAVKAALHRGRGRLAELQSEPRRVPAPAALDAFCAAFNARDLEALTALLLTDATIEIPGANVDLGVETTMNPAKGIVFHTVASPLSVGIPESYLEGYVPGALARAERRDVQGLPVVLLWYAHRDGEHVRAVLRLDWEQDRIARLRAYFISPELVAELCAALALPCRTNGHGTD